MIRERPLELRASENIFGWKIRNGERAGARTRDHLIKSQVLYQLSYALKP